MISTLIIWSTIIPVGLPVIRINRIPIIIWSINIFFIPRIFQILYIRWHLHLYRIFIWFLWLDSMNENRIIILRKIFLAYLFSWNISFYIIILRYWVHLIWNFHLIKWLLIFIGLIKAFDIVKILFLYVLLRFWCIVYHTLMIIFRLKRKLFINVRINVRFLCLFLILGV